jgi:hypothetical protein
MIPVGDHPSDAREVMVRPAGPNEKWSAWPETAGNLDVSTDVLAVNLSSKIVVYWARLSGVAAVVATVIDRAPFAVTQFTKP